MLPGTPAFSRICNLSPATLNELRREFDNAVGSVSGAVSRSCSTHPPVSIWDNECHVVVEVDVPGVQQSDLEVSVEDRVLTVSGNRRPSKHGGEPKNLDGRFGKFCRAIKLHESLDTTSRLNCTMASWSCRSHAESSRNRELFRSRFDRVQSMNCRKSQPTSVLSQRFVDKLD